MLQVNKACRALIQPSLGKSPRSCGRPSISKEEAGWEPYWDLINQCQITAKATSIPIKGGQMQNCNWTTSSFKPTVGLPGYLSKSLLVSQNAWPRNCTSQWEKELCWKERVYALSCGAVSLLEFTVNHIAFIARFSILSSVGFIHCELVPIRTLARDHKGTWLHIII